MKFKSSFLLIVWLVATFSAVQSQPASCLDRYRSFSPLEPEVHPTSRNQDYGYTAVWYMDSRCIVVGAPTGLWLYDIEQPDNPMRLAQIKELAIDNIAVNPADSTIAFSVAQEPLVYLLHADGTISTQSASGQAVTAISFSPDGRLFAVASAILDEVGLDYDSRLQIWDMSNKFQTELTFYGYHTVAGIFFDSDNQHLLTDSFMPGITGNDVDYWDVSIPSKLWNFYDLLPYGKAWTNSDPLAPAIAIMHDRLVAVGGLGGYVNFNEYSEVAVQIYDGTTRKRTSEIVIYERGSSDSDVGLVDIAFNSDGSELVSSQSNGTIKIWNVADGTQIDKFASNLALPQVAFSPDDQFLAVQSQSEMLIWDVDQKRPYTTIHLAS